MFSLGAVFVKDLVVFNMNVWFSVALKFLERVKK